MIKRYSQFAETLYTPDDNTPYLSGLPFMSYLYTGEIVYHTVEQNEENRLDLIAYKFFQDPSYWYPIALYNSLYDPLCLPIGTELAIPVDALSGSNYQPFTYQ
jgi:hypothetical protein